MTTNSRNGNGGGNFNISKSSSKWVTEQTSLSGGGTVDIYVEDKTTLTGAVIASDTGDLTLDTGSFEYSHLRDRNRSYNVGGGVNAGGGTSTTAGVTSKNDPTYSVNGDYGFSDSRQTNFATIGEGTIIIRDGSSIGTPGEYSGLKRDVSKAQYSTKEGGLQGGFTVDSTMVNLIAEIVDDPSKAYESRKEQVLKGLNDAKDTTVLISNEAKNAVKATSIWLDEHLFTSDDEANGDDNVKAGPDYTDKQKEQLLSYNDKKGFRDVEQLLNEKNSLLGKIKDQTGWDGNDLINTNGTVILDQDPSILAKYGLPYHTGACVFLSTVDGVAKALGIDLQPEEKALIYKSAKKNGSVCSERNGTYGVNNYDILAKTVAAVAYGLPADTVKDAISSAKATGNGNISCPNTGKTVKASSVKSKQNATVAIVQTIKNGGAVDIQYAPLPGKKSNHTMSVVGTSVNETGNVIFHVNDTLHPERKTYINSSSMLLYTMNEETKKIKPIERKIVNYRPITNNNGE